MKKNNETALQTIGGLELRTMDEMGRFAQAAMASGYFRDMKEAASGIIKVQWGAELGIGPVASLQGIHNIQGKLAMSGTLIASLIQRHPSCSYVVQEMSNDAVKLACYRDGKFIGPSEFTIEDAKAAQLLGNSTWKKYPRNMLFARAIANAARWYFADIFSGAPVYTPDEVEAGDDVLEVEALSISEVVEAEAQETVRPTNAKAQIEEEMADETEARGVMKAERDEPGEDVLTLNGHTIPVSEAGVLDTYLRALRAADDGDQLMAALEEHGGKLMGFSEDAKAIARWEYNLAMASAQGDQNNVDRLQANKTAVAAWEAADLLLGEGR